MFQDTQSSSTGSSVPHSTPGGRSGETPGGRNKEESAARERRKESKQQTSPVHAPTTSRPRSAGTTSSTGQSSSSGQTASTGQSSSLNLSSSKTTHQALLASYGLPSTTGQSGLTMPHVSSQTGQTGMDVSTLSVQSESGQSRFQARTSDVTQHKTSSENSENSQFLHSTSTKPVSMHTTYNKPRTSPQPYRLDVGGVKVEGVVNDKGVSVLTPVPPSGQKPADSTQPRHMRLLNKSNSGVQVNCVLHVTNLFMYCVCTTCNCCM